MSDLEERERAAFAPDPAEVQRKTEERIVRQFHEEIEKIKAMHATKEAASKKEAAEGKGSAMSDEEREKILKVYWEKAGGEDYSAQRLRELFSEFGEVGDVIKKEKKKRGFALVAMATKDAAVAAMGNVFGNLSNPLLVLPYQKVKATNTPTMGESNNLETFAGINHQAYGDSILLKLQKVGDLYLIPIFFCHFIKGVLDYMDKTSSERRF